MSDAVKITLDKKTGFKNNPRFPVIIDDERGKEFYNTSELKKPVEFFNLPAGTYYVLSGDFEPMKYPVAYPLNNLPVPERWFKPLPSKFPIYFEPTKHKAFISWKDKKIVFDPALKERSLPELFYVLFHEFGHRHYYTESYVDAWAENQMLNEGFNPSQIHKALVTVLSDRQLLRKKKTIDRLMKRI